MGSCCVEKKPDCNGVAKRQERMDSAVHDSVKVGKMPTACCTRSAATLMSLE